MNFRATAFGILVLGLSASGKQPALAEAIGDWTVGAGQGFVEYIVRSGPGNSFNISCDVGASLEGENKRTSIFIEIVGKSPPPNSQIRIFLDGKPVDFSADNSGSIRTDCNACSGSFSYLWDRARKSKQMIVTLSDGRNAAFRLAGAAKVLSVKHCTTGYEG